MADLKDLEKRISAIEARNNRVEADKAWETSLTRRLIVAALTYGVIGLFLSIIHTEHAWISAFVATIGFYLSTVAVSFAKSLWLKRHQK